MKTVAVIAQKGGPGKSTLAINLAVAAHLEGKQTIIADTDKQQTSNHWYEDRKKTGLTLPYVRQCFPENISEFLKTAQNNGAEMLFIDTAPHSGPDSVGIAELSDLILIPCRPGLKDLRALKMTVDITRLSGKPALAVLNACKTRSPEPDKAERYLAKMGLAASPVRIGDRVAFEYAYINGQGVQEYEPQGKAAEEIQDLYTYMCRHLYTSTQEEKQAYGQAKA
jgi:chromosome partitioning protein